MLVFAAGIFAGTSVPNGGRLSVGGKSPLTGGIKEANSGGSAARALAELGLRGIKVAGRADRALACSWSRADGGKLVARAGARGSRLVRRPSTVLRKQYGDKVSLICIGPAGEMGMKAAAVLVTTADHYLRAAARGGLGAVMGSKNLKAIVIDGAGGPGVTVADPAALKDASKALTKGIHSHPAMAALEALGSAFLVNVTQSMGCLATKNFSAGTCDKRQDITGEHMVELMPRVPMADPKHSCMKGCIINCSQVYTDEAGEVITSGVEFETIGLMGSNCQIDDLDQIARLDRLCDDLGLDTMDVGAAMGVAMEGGLLAVGRRRGARSTCSAGLTGGDEDAALLAAAAPRGQARSACRASRPSRDRASPPTTRACSRAPAPPTSRAPQGADHTCGNALPSPANPMYDPSVLRGPGADLGVPAVLLRRHRLAGHVPVRHAPGAGHARSCRASSSGRRRAPSPARSCPRTTSSRMGDEIVRMERDFNRRAGFTRRRTTACRRSSWRSRSCRRATGTTWPRPTWTRCSPADRRRARGAHGGRDAIRQARRSARRPTGADAGEAFVVRALAKGLAMLGLFDSGIASGPSTRWWPSSSCRA